VLRGKIAPFRLRQQVRSSSEMFAVLISYLAIVQQVAHCCCLSYISGIHEILKDGASSYGIEVDLPVLCFHLGSARIFLASSVAYEAAAFQ